LQITIRARQTRITAKLFRGFRLISSYTIVAGRAQAFATTLDILGQQYGKIFLKGVRFNRSEIEAL